MSLLMYNGIVLNLLKTNSVERVSRLSDDGTEYIHTEWTINVTAVYNPSVIATSYGPGPVLEQGFPPMVTDAAIRHGLMQPRRSLRYQEGGIDIVFVPINLADGGAIDAWDGPIPQSCSISRIAGPRLFYVNYSVKCFIVECPEDSECGGLGGFACALVSSRYSRTEHIDEQYRSTMIVAGTAYFRSDILAQIGVSADAFRGFLVPPQLIGYKRNNIQFMLDRNGLKLDYVCTDIENFKDLGTIDRPGTAAAAGITSMDLKYSCGPALGGSGRVKVVGYGAYVNVFASAKGMKAANTLTMTLFLLSICVQKLGTIFGNDRGKIGLPMGSRITEDVFAKEVTVSLDYFVVPDIENGQLANASVPIIGWIGDPPFGPDLINLPDLGGLNPQPPFSNGTRGTAAYQLAVSEFAHACFSILSPDESDLTPVGQPPDTYVPGQSFGNPPSVQGLEPPESFQPPQTPYYRSRGLDNFRSLGNSPDQTAYMEYSVDDSQSTYTGVIQLPVTSQPSTSLDTSSPSKPPNDPSWYDSVSCVNIRLFNPISTKKVKWSITRVGCVPEVPDPKPIEELDSSYTLLSRVVSPKAIELDSSGGIPVYRIDGEYTYSITKSILNEPTIPFAIPPSITLVPNEFTEMQPGDFISGIINNQTTNNQSQNIS